VFLNRRNLGSIRCLFDWLLLTLKRLPHLYHV